MATPHVSGAAALILSACSLNTDALRTTILSSVDPVPALAGKTSTAGRLNVFNAIERCASPAVTSFTSTKASPYPASGFSPITWTAIAQGALPLEYQFTRQLGAASPITSSWSGSNTFTWTPAPADVGSWTISVAVRTAGTTAQATASLPFTLTTYTTVAVTGVTTPTAFPAPAGTAVTWTATTTGGVPPLEYQFLRYSGATGLWQVVQPYGSSNTFTWTPGPADVGFYVIGVYARTVGSPVPYQAALGAPVFEIVAAPLVIAGLTTPTTFPATAATTITWTATTTGGTLPLEYEFLRYSGTSGLWQVVQPYGPSNAFTWTPGPSGTGSFVVGVYVRTQGSSAGYQAALGSAWFTIIP
jgi:hypothetical protein